MGLSIGIHLLNLLAIFFVAMIIYYKKYKFSIPSFLAMMGISIVVFLSVYPVTIILIPKLSGQIGSMTYGLIGPVTFIRSEEHTSELQSRGHLVCRLLLEKKKQK